MTIIEECFTYHSPTLEQVDQTQAVRGAARVLARAIENQCPPCADRDAALRKVGEASMTANRAIILKGLV